MRSLLYGVLVQWSGAVVDIPDGYLLCDGTNGTPNLRDKFIVGAGDSYAVHAIGGELVHTHNATGNWHDHNIVGGSDIAAGANFAPITDGEQFTGTTDNGSAVPPYYSLAYIMKV